MKPNKSQLGYIVLLFICKCSLYLAVDGNPSCDINDESARDKQCSWPADDTTAQNTKEEDDGKVKSFQTFLKLVQQTVEESSKVVKTRAEQERRILSTVLEFVGMDPLFIDQRPLTMNWLYELHSRILNLAPRAFWKIFGKRPTQKEFDTIVALDLYAQELAQGNLQDLRMYAFSPHRDRGMVAGLSMSFSSSVLLSLQHLVGYATPSPQVLERLSLQYTPIVEVGAGNGYWSACLEQLYNVKDVSAYDLEPPPTANADKNANDNKFSFASKAFTKVQQSSCQELFSKQNETPESRSLLMIWPNNPDQWDNRHHSSSKNQQDLPWDSDCLLAFLQAGGTTVIFVGEREAEISVRPDRPPDCGMSATRRFQILLNRWFDLVEEYQIPNWFGVDDVTIWQKKQDYIQE